MESDRLEVSCIAQKKKRGHSSYYKRGKFILLYRGDFSWVQCLSLYLSKDVVEKGFDVLKNDIELMPINLKTSNSLRGYLFVTFLALILRIKLMRMMIDAELNKRYTVEGLLTSWKKLRSRYSGRRDDHYWYTQTTARNPRRSSYLCLNAGQLSHEVRTAFIFGLSRFPVVYL